MADHQQDEALPQEASEPFIVANVVPIFGRLPRPYREAPATDDELAEYRRIRPRLLKMLEEWDALTGEGGCPIARSRLGK